MEKAINDKTCAVMLEPIQAEGGIYPADKDYMSSAKDLTREKDILMVLDEVQTGMGRTGNFFGYEHYGIEPDIMSLAKALGNGFPVGAIIAKDAVMRPSSPGPMHRHSEGTRWQVPRWRPPSIPLSMKA